MDRAELAQHLVATTEPEQITLLTHHVALADVALAQVLKAIYLDANTSDPTRAMRAVAALNVLQSIKDDPEIHALAAWTAGMAALQISGHVEQAITFLDQATSNFQTLEQPHTAAATQVSKVYALAMLGRYDEAIECGLRARDVLLAHNDILTAGKIDQNLGNIYHRREYYHEAEQFYRLARDCFMTVGDQKELAKAENNLANVLSLQHEFHSAKLLFEQALVRAGMTGLEVTQAEIESNLGWTEFDQGHYDLALDYLERSRRRYSALGMSYKSAIADLELADAYLELNLVPEAAAIYARVAPTLTELRMRAEQAHVLAYHGRACLLLNQIDQAEALLAQARTLYIAEDNAAGAAMVTLTEAHLFYHKGDYESAAAAAAHAEGPLAAAGTWGRLLLARWLRGEAIRMLGRASAAQALLTNTLDDAKQWTVPHVAQRCHTSLGLLAASTGNMRIAEQSFKQAVALIETMRAPLPAEQFRTAFVADKLTPYTELVRLCLADANTGREIEAFNYVERARARALVDMLGGAVPYRSYPRDSFEIALLERLNVLREELNWFYNQINRSPDSESQSPT